VTDYLNPSTRHGGVKQIVVPDRATVVPVDDAPFDDEQYVRINGEWVPYNTPPIIPDTLAPKPPTALSGDGTMAPNGTRVDYELEWTAPTQNTDDSPLTDFAYYVVRWRYGLGGVYQMFTTKETTFALPGLVPATNIEWGVLARDYSGNDSTWATNTITGVVDTVGPAKPSAPTLTSQLGTVTAAWDGLANGGGAMSADFARLDLYQSATTGGPWTLVDSLRGPGTIVVASVPVGTTRFFSSIAIDTSGNASVRSTEASIVVQGIEIPDIDTTVFDSIDTDIAAAKAEAEAYTQARGTDLITNGTGVMGDATNFDTSFTFNGTDAPVGASGSFYAKNTFAYGAMTDEFQPYDPVKRLRLSFQMRQTVAGAVSKAYGFLAPHDGGGNAIGPQHYMYITGTQTTLAAPLNPGDTTITLTSSANWYGSAGKPAGAASYFRSIQFWDFVDTFGKAWPAYSYTRNVLSSDQYADGGISGNVITLRAPYSGAAKAAGTPVSQPSAGGSYLYMPSLTNGVVPEAWTTYADTHAGGIFPSASQAVPSTGGAVWASGMPPGTAKVKVGWLLNYAPTSGRHAVAAVSLSDASAANHSANNITTVQITDNAITAPKITANAVIADKIAADAVTSDKILAGAIVAGKIGAGEIIAGKLAANAVLAGNISAEAVEANNIAAGAIQATHLTSVMAVVTKLCSSTSGRRWEADQYGIRVYESDGTILINFPTDPSTPSSFYGDLMASSLTVEDQLAIRGLVNEISKGAQVVLAGGTTAPTSAPTVTIDWESYPAEVGLGFDPYRAGWHRYGAHYYTAQQVYGIGVTINRYNLDGTRDFWGFDITNGAAGAWVNQSMTMIGNIIYVLSLNSAGTTYYVQGWNVDTQTRTTAPWVYPHVFGTSGGAHRQPKLGTDGTNLWIFFTNYSSNQIQWRKYVPTTGAAVGGTSAGTAVFSREFDDVYVGNGDFGSQRIIVVAADLATAYVLTAAGAPSPNEYFTLPSAQTGALTYDSTLGIFIHFDNSGKRYSKLTSTKWTTESSMWHLSNTWYDGDATGGTHETAQSPRKSFTMLKRARLNVTTAILPVRPIPNTTDDAKATRIYIGRGAADPGRTYMERMATLADGARNWTSTNITLPAGTATSPPPASSDFPASSPGKLVSADGSSIILNGDGSFTLGTISRDATGVMSETPTPWIAPTLTNSWVNYVTGGHRVAGYRKLKDGTVELRGLVKSGTSGAGTGIFTLPVGFRPTEQEVFLQTANHPTASQGFARVDVFPTGQVQVVGYGPSATNAFLSLAGIRFSTN
jgi:hypothetical protein